MQLVSVYYGQTHAVIALGDKFKGKQALDLACHPGLEITPTNERRYSLFEGTECDLACHECRDKLNL